MVYGVWCMIYGVRFKVNDGMVQGVVYGLQVSVLGCKRQSESVPIAALGPRIQIERTKEEEHKEEEEVQEEVQEQKDEEEKQGQKKEKLWSAPGNPRR